MRNSKIFKTEKKILNRCLRPLVAFFIMFSIVEAAKISDPNSFRLLQAIDHTYIPLDISIGFGTTWFSPKMINVSTKIVNRPDYLTTGALRATFNKSSNLLWIDHVPVFLASGDLIASFKARTSDTNQKLAVKLIRMKCDKKGNFSKFYSNELILKGRKEENYSIKFNEISRGLYILRIELLSLKESSYLDLYDFHLYPSGTKPIMRLVQLAPKIDDVVFSLNDHVNFGAEIHLQKTAVLKVDFEINLINGDVVEKGSLGKFNGPGHFQPKKVFLPKDYGLYLVTYNLSGSWKQVIQRAFSVLPEGDSSFMGLHAYPTSRGRHHLILGRKLGFKHYRDHDMGRFTRWSHIQPGDPSRFSPENPPPFRWKGDNDIKYIVEDLGYNYLGVLYDTPSWAKDHNRALPKKIKFPPVKSAWQNYVRSIVRHYSGDLGLIREWEIWNEGKGILGKKNNDSTIYIELMRLAIEEINRIQNENTDLDLKKVGLVGIINKEIWKEVLRNVQDFEVASVHWKASAFRDTYNPPRRKDRERRKKWSRTGWLNTVKTLIQENGTKQQLWDSEGGMLNQVYPIYNYYQTANIENVGFPVADRSAHGLYSQYGKTKYGPILPLEAASVMVKQTIGHKSAGISRCYMYYFSNRDFVSQRYAEQMLEYDGTLMPYTHAFVYCSKLLENLNYDTRKFVTGTSIVRERFISDNGKIIDVMWNEAATLDEVVIPDNFIVRDMMGQRITNIKNNNLIIGENPVFLIKNSY
jgi:hypothetical protein